MKTTVINIVRFLVAGLIFNGAAILVLSIPFRWLWNALLPDIISVPRLSYAKTVGLLCLLTLLRWALSGVKLKANFRDKRDRQTQQQASQTPNPSLG
jgi:hypothetical protein